MSTRSVVAITESGKYPGSVLSAPRRLSRRRAADPGSVLRMAARGEDPATTPRRRPAGWCCWVTGRRWRCSSVGPGWKTTDRIASSRLTRNFLPRYKQIEPSKEPQRGWQCGCYEPIADDGFQWDLEWLHVVDVNSRAWHPVDVREHPEISKAVQEGRQLYFGSSDTKLGSPERTAADEAVERASDEVNQMYLSVIESVGQQLTAGEVASWQPEEPAAEQAAAP